MAEEVTEQDLVCAAASGDQQAFHRLYSENVSAILAFVARRVPPADVEDVTAETFARAWQNVATFEWRGVPFRAWLYRVAQNLIVSRARRADHRLTGPLLGEEEAIDSGFEDAVVTGAESRALLGELERLNDRQRLVLELRFLGELSVPETAELLDLTEEGVRALTYRALKALRALVRSAE